MKIDTNAYEIVYQTYAPNCINWRNNLVHITYIQSVTRQKLIIADELNFDKHFQYI